MDSLQNFPPGKIGRLYSPCMRLQEAPYIACQYTHGKDGLTHMPLHTMFIKPVTHFFFWQGKVQNAWELKESIWFPHKRIVDQTRPRHGSGTKAAGQGQVDFFSHLEKMWRPRELFSKTTGGGGVGGWHTGIKKKNKVTKGTCSMEYKVFTLDI